MTPIDAVYAVLQSSLDGLTVAGLPSPDRTMVAATEPAADCNGLYAWLDSVHVSDQPVNVWGQGNAGMRCLGIPVVNVAVRYDACLTVTPDGRPPTEAEMAADLVALGEPAWAVYRQVLADGLADVWCPCDGFSLSAGATSVGGGIGSFQFTVSLQLSGGLDGS